MQIVAGTRLGPYEVVEPIGAGGMGEVYRARDTRLDRDVAVKVLPSEFNTNAQLKIRFEREAKTISQLNHPHICTLYDVGDGYLVMEMLDGESLADRLIKGPLPTEQVLRVGMEIASALDRAHRQGIVHRDLKPGNIMLTRSGSKLLDFGLAKESVGAGPLAGTTVQKPLTQEGTILGTFEYMAPEQLEGREADARSDIFALGVVLYEMVTGRRAFEGKTKASLIASILDRDPIPVTTLQPVTPPALEHVINTCLEKDPDARWQTAHDVLLELKWIDRAGSGAGAPAVSARRRKMRERGAWLLAAIAAAAAVSVTAWHFGTKQPPRVIQASILAPEKVAFAFDGVLGPLVLSRDGKRMAFIGTSDGKNMIWVESLDAGAAQPLAGTQGAAFPFWSYDGRYIGFFAGGKLKKIAASGGPPQSLCDVPPNARGGSWNPDDTIIFSPGARDPLSRISAAGGTAVPVTQLNEKDSEYSHRYPWFLPDGRHFLYLSQSFSGGADRNKIYAGSLDSKEKKLILSANSPPMYSRSGGYLLFVRDRTLVAQRFDAKRLEVAGDPQPVAEDIQFFSNSASATFGVSEEGVLAYHHGAGSSSHLVWLDRNGKEVGTTNVSGDISAPRISRRGDRIVYSVVDPQGPGNDLWILDVARGVPTRFTFEPGDEVNPAWSPDDSLIAYSGEHKQGLRDIFVKPSSGAAPAEMLYASPTLKFVTDWSRDGRFILFNQLDPKSKTGSDIYVLDVPKKTTTAVVQTRFNESSGSFSPDGKWIAYVSDATGSLEVYVQPFPSSGTQWQVTTGGGGAPQWSDDGKQLFFRSADSKLCVVSIETAPTLRLSIPTALFPLRARGFAAGRQWQPTANGQRFLVNEPLHEDAPAPITIVTNWAELLKK